MASLHQLRCFLAAFEHRSFTAAAADLAIAQPSLSEQVRLLERSLGAALFRRAGRGVVPTEAADALRPHAQRALAEVEAARRAVAAVSALETGTVRFGLFGTARLYLGATLVADVLERHPGVRVEIQGENSAAVQEDLRRGHVEAAMIALPVAGAGMSVTPVAREEMLYVSRDPGRVAAAVTARQLAEASLVLPWTTWRHQDTGRLALAQRVQETGRTLRTRIEVEDVETALELVQRGLADSVLPRGVITELGAQLAPDVRSVPLRPRLHVTLAVVHRQDAVLSPATRVVIDLAVRRIREVLEPLTLPAKRSGASMAGT